jgi:hypothetical protein
MMTLASLSILNSTFASEIAQCDACPARSRHRVLFTVGHLDFCSHHYKKFEVALTSQGLGVINRE